jgi:hypothetical protein
VKYSYFNHPDFPFKVWIYHYDRKTVEVAVLGMDWYSAEEADYPDTRLYVQFADGLITQSRWSELCATREDALKVELSRTIATIKNYENYIVEWREKVLSIHAEIER